MTTQKKILDLTGSQYLVQKVKSAINDVGSSLSTHIADTDIHVTTADKNKWNNGVSQSYVLRYSSTAITDNSTIAYSTIDNTDNIKSGDKILDVDGKIFSIVSVDSDNSTVTVGSALIDLALDANVMHLSGNETVAGIKTFSDIPIFATFDGIRFRCVHNPNAYVTFRNANQANPGSIIFSANDGNVSTSIHLVDKSLIPYINNDMVLGSSVRLWSDFYTYHGYFRGQQQNDEYSGNARTNLTLLANRDSVGQSGCVVDTFRENTTQGTGSHILGIGMKENSVRFEGCRFSWLYDDNNNGYVFSLRPTTQGTNQPIKYELGTSSAKWSTFNGLNPSSLSLPDLSNGIDISSYITTGDTDNNYTPPANGWIWIRLIGNGASITQGDFGINSSYVTNNITNEKWVETNLFVTKNVQATIRCRGITGIIGAKFYPCQGNV